MDTCNIKTICVKHKMGRGKDVKEFLDRIEVTRLKCTV